MKNKLVKTAIIVVLAIAVVFGLGVLAEACNVSLYSASQEVRDNSAINAAKVEVVKEIIWDAYSNNKMPADTKTSFENYVRQLITADTENKETTNSRYLGWFNADQPVTMRNRIVGDVLFGSRNGNGYKMLFPDINVLQGIVDDYATITWDKLEVHSRNSLTVAKYAIHLKYSVQYHNATATNYDNVMYIKLLGNVSFHDEKVDVYPTSYFEANRGDPFDNEMAGWDLDANFNRYPVSQSNRDVYASKLVEYNVAKLLIKEGYEAGKIKLSDMISVVESILRSDAYNTPSAVEDRLSKLATYTNVLSYQKYLDNLQLNPPAPGQEPPAYNGGVKPGDSEMSYWQSTEGLAEIEEIILDAIFGEDNGNGWKLTDANYNTVKGALATYATLTIKSDSKAVYARNSLNIYNYAIKFNYTVDYLDTATADIVDTDVVLVMTLEDNNLRAHDASLWSVADFDTYKGIQGTDAYAPIRAFDKPASYTFPN